MRLADFLNLLDGTRASGEGHIAKCPAHADGRASLSVGSGEGRILVHCHTGCTALEIVDAMGLCLQDLFVADAAARYDGEPAKPRRASLETPRPTAWRGQYEAMRTLARRNMARVGVLSARWGVGTETLYDMGVGIDREAFAFPMMNDERELIGVRMYAPSDGRKWASLELEDEHGAQLRIRFDQDAHKRWREIIDLGSGALLAVRLSVGPRGGIKADWMVDLLALRREWVSRGRVAATPASELADWPTWQACLIRGEHPIYLAKKGSPATDRWWRESGLHNVLITKVKTIWDRNRNQMAFLRAEGIEGRAREVVVFASTWAELETPIEAGQIVGLKARLDGKRGSLLCDRAIVRATCT